MAHDKAAAGRVRQFLSQTPGVTEARMMGTLAFMANGNMCCGVVGSALMVRVGADARTAALAEPYVRPMEIAGRPLDGFVLVDPEGYAGDDALAAWVGRGLAFAASLPAKPAGKRR